MSEPGFSRTRLNQSEQFLKGHFAAAFGGNFVERRDCIDCVPKSSRRECLQRGCQTLKGALG